MKYRAPVVGLLLVMLGSGHAVAASSFVNWTQYLFSAKHTSENPAATTITPANASTLKLAWRFTPDPGAIPGLGGFYASPTVYNGVVYIGARNGYFYALKDTTGAVIWKRLIGYVAPTTCGPEGFTATATVKPDPTTHKPTIYVYGATGYLYAMDAATGNDVWAPAAVAIPSATQNDYYAWGSPLVSGGNIYVPVSSQCDQPLVRGGLLEFSQTSGALENRYFSTPAGTVGASIWSSPMSSGTSVFVTTGNGPVTTSDAYSIVKLTNALAKTDIWTVPVAQRDADGDFGGSPGMWTATLAGVSTKMVGACNKNGVFYAFKVRSLSTGPVWTMRAGNPDSVGPGQCDAAPVWDGSHLFVAGNGISLNSVAHDGSVSKVNPATGAILWQTGLTGSVIGTPGMDGAGVIAAATYGSSSGQNGVFLIDSSTGQILKTVSYGTAQTFGQPVFADRYLFVASRGNGLRVYTVS
jgi:outer membrane protein assembly factor BamB